MQTVRAVLKKKYRLNQKQFKIKKGKLTLDCEKEHIKTRDYQKKRLKPD